VFLRYDDHALYAAFRRRTVVDRQGKPQPWRTEAKGEDAAIEKDDAFELFLSSAPGTSILHLGLSASGARYDAAAVQGEPEREQWNGVWESAVVLTEEWFCAEIAVPWPTLAALEIDREKLLVNLQAIRACIYPEAPLWPGGRGRVADPEHGIRQPLLSLGATGRARCRNFVAAGLEHLPEVPRRTFTVRLHFCEPNLEMKPGDRVFDILIQGQNVATAFDIVAAGGAPRVAVVREYKGVTARGQLSIVLMPQGTGNRRKPVLSGIEVYDEFWQNK